MTTALDLVSCLALIPDRRRREGRMYSQVGVIVFSLIALLSGARSYRQIHTLIQRRPWAPQRRLSASGAAAGAGLHVGAGHLATT